MCIKSYARASERNQQLSAREEANQETQRQQQKAKWMTENYEGSNFIPGLKMTPDCA